jgi:hypothetical protein
MTEWYQSALTPPEVLEIRLRIGLIVEQDHAQAMIEVVDPISSIQVAQWSMPHTTVTQLPRSLEEVVNKLRELVADHVDLF